MGSAPRAEGPFLDAQHRGGTRGAARGGRGRSGGGEPGVRRVRPLRWRARRRSPPPRTGVETRGIRNVLRSLRPRGGSRPPPTRAAPSAPPRGTPLCRGPSPTHLEQTQVETEGEVAGSPLATPDVWDRGRGRGKERRETSSLPFLSDKWRLPAKWVSEPPQPCPGIALSHLSREWGGGVGRGRQFTLQTWSSRVFRLQISTK